MTSNNNNKSKFMDDLDASVDVLMSKGYDRKKAIGKNSNKNNNFYYYIEEIYLDVTREKQQQLQPTTASQFDSPGSRKKVSLFT